MGRSSTFGKKELKALYATYGEANLYNSGSFEPLTRNLTTGAPLKKGHHCDICQAKMSVSCYEKFHYAYCPTWVTRKGKRERCGERFCVHSKGCGKHARVQGYNKPLYRAADGEDADLSEFDDFEPFNLDEEDDDNNEEDFQAHWEARAEVEEELRDRHGFVPKSFYDDHYAELGKQKAREQQNKKAAVEAPNVDSDIALDTTVIRNGKTGWGKTRAGKTGVGKKGKHRRDSIAEPPIPDRGQNRRFGGATYGGIPSSGQANSGAGLPLRSYAPRGSRPKPQMEAPRCPAGQQQTDTKETKKERARKFLNDKVLGKKK